MTNPERSANDAATQPMTPIGAGELHGATSSPSETPTGSGPRRQQALVDREERRSERARVITAVGVGIIGWNVFGLIDIARFAIGVVPSLSPLVIRIAMTLPTIGVWAWLRAAKDASPRVVRAVEIFAFTYAGAGLGLFAIADGGLESFHVTGLPLVVLGHALLLGSEWRRGLAPIAGPLLALPLVLAAGARFDAELAAHWQSTSAIVRFAEDYSLSIGAAVLALLGGHAVSSLRREARSARSIGRYELRRKIGTGGMGEVWSAYHRALRRDVAVKLMQPRLGQSDLAAARFEREVRALAELTHPYIVRVLDYGTTEDGIWYYAMELLDGEDLGTIVECEGPIAHDRAARILRQAAEALAEAHAHGMVHRDVKPQNLLLVRSEGGGEFVKLIDFGIAKLEDEGDLTMTGMALGTPGYMAPEVITGGEATARSDVYALGAVLYYLLAGRAPLDAKTPRALVVAHVAEEPPPPSARLGAPLPPALEAVVMRCLAKDASARFAHAGELAAALASLPIGD